MKFIDKLFLEAVVLILSPAIGLVQGVNEGQQCLPQCLPVNSIIFWDLAATEDVFAVQRHYLFRIIDTLPDGSYIKINMLGKTLEFVIILPFIKDKSKEWVLPINNIKRENAEPHVIPYKNFVDATTLYASSKEKETDQLFFIVNNNLTIDDEGRMLETTTHLKSFVVYMGSNTPSEFWNRLASDENHFLNLNDDTDVDVESFLKLSCKVEDTSSFCDSNSYWTGSKCTPCTYICSRTPSEDPPYCRDACKNFRTTPSASVENKGNAIFVLITGYVFIFVMKILF